MVSHHQTAATADLSCYWRSASIVNFALFMKVQFRLLIKHLEVICPHTHSLLCDCAVCTEWNISTICVRECVNCPGRIPACPLATVVVDHGDPD